MSINRYRYGWVDIRSHGTVEGLLFFFILWCFISFYFSCWMTGLMTINVVLSNDITTMMAGRFAICSLGMKPVF